MSTVKLTRPIKTHGGDVAEITLKEPLARSFFLHGEPFKTNVTTDDKGKIDVEFDFNNAVMAKFIADMSGLDDLVLASLLAVDYVNLRAQVAHMVIGVAGTNPIQT